MFNGGECGPAGRVNLGVLWVHAHVRARSGKGVCREERRLWAEQHRGSEVRGGRRWFGETAKKEQELAENMSSEKPRDAGFKQADCEGNQGAPWDRQGEGLAMEDTRV